MKHDRCAPRPRHTRKCSTASTSEMLVYRLVPWTAFLGVATRSQARSLEASQALATVGVETFVGVRQEWHF
ncbi:DarT ssDNA thymidine ADP-ribosyltransferase family protein [Candidatus Poriferisodalis sp.]|uniref:DarT ssDNA thymidine ADP-ribosyltransferase family protein n=1 Tax=Candidatus Poriferisodalis sp. TaxID=3101277 RepID=UPI003D12E810